MLAVLDAVVWLKGIEVELLLGGFKLVVVRFELLAAKKEPIAVMLLEVVELAK